MIAAKQKPNYTIDDIYALPDGTRAEIIDGQIYYMAPPSRRHQDILFALSRKIADYIDSRNGTCKVYLAPFAVFLNKDGQNYLEPDISVICDSQKLTKKGCEGAPDWVIEIVSPYSRQMDYYKKLFQYHIAGVREYWIIDPEKNMITVYDFQHEYMAEYSFSDQVKAGIYEDFRIDFSKIKTD